MQFNLRIIIMLRYTCVTTNDQTSIENIQLVLEDRCLECRVKTPHHTDKCSVGILDKLRRANEELAWLSEKNRQAAEELARGNRYQSDRKKISVNSKAVVCGVTTKLIEVITKSAQTNCLLKKKN